MLLSSRLNESDWPIGNKKSPLSARILSVKLEGRVLFFQYSGLEGCVALGVRREPKKGRAGDKHIRPEVEELFCVVQGHAAIDLDEGLEATGADCA